ncbi:heme ABC transporter substrate-binding protein IsdE [Romboutsia ilealis]|uniref:High-affinity heme uptake system protein IsdE n=1 Tax=Romboutsia faecis TaxID=2764597 RepID=A0ABR7JKW7_9FIRM|nr:heme ABC transporter substrate-binding protein IsdE [Romboutsia faecis]MBC5995552.1 heme ABC transporter substrate-binding protein IsdE [Romboutsia faecis]MRN23752.1 heme ABC transporter substrate-binding protein IsdE [Romboutsia ilealis]
MKFKKYLISICTSVMMLSVVGCSNTSIDNSNSKEDKLNKESYGDDSVVIATSVAVAQILDELGIKISGIPTTSYDIPEGAKDAVEVGTPMNPDLEIIKSLNPDVVVSVDTLGQDFIDNFKQNNIPSEFVNLTSYNDLKETITTLGEKFNKIDKANEIINELETKESELESKFNNNEKPNVLVVFGAPGTMMLGTEKCYVGNLVDLAGGKNVLENSTSSFVQINKEELLNLNPDKIVVMTHADPETTKAQVKNTLETDAAWKNLNAVKNGEVYYLENDYFGMSANLKVIEALDMMHDLLY